MDERPLLPAISPDGRMTVSSRPPLARRAWWILGVGLACLVSVGLVSAAFAVQSSGGAAGGMQNGSTFMADWQQTGALSAAMPNPVPAAVSLAEATPTRLPAAGQAWTLDPAVSGDQALEWTFAEAAGTPVNLEFEVAYSIQYSVGGVLHSAGGTFYLESQVAVIGAGLTYEFYWDSGAAAGITFGAESEIGQACTAVGNCP